MVERPPVGTGWRKLLVVYQFAGRTGNGVSAFRGLVRVATINVE
jgi:hypothetical protein